MSHEEDGTQHEEFKLPEGVPPPKSIKFFGFAWDDFKPKFKDKDKQYITKANIYLIDGHGFYAQAVMSSMECIEGMFEVVHREFNIKIDVEKKAFLIITQEGPKTIQETMRVENVDKMIENVISVISGEPIAEVKFQMAQDEDPDSADWWKGKGSSQEDSDPDWWKKGKKPE